MIKKILLALGIVAAPFVLYGTIGVLYSKLYAGAYEYLDLVPVLISNTVAYALVGAMLMLVVYGIALNRHQILVPIACLLAPAIMVVTTVLELNSMVRVLGIGFYMDTLHIKSIFAGAYIVMAVIAIVAQASKRKKQTLPTQAVVEQQDQ